MNIDRIINESAFRIWSYVRMNCMSLDSVRCTAKIEKQIRRCLDDFERHVKDLSARLTQAKKDVSRLRKENRYLRERLTIQGIDYAQGRASDNAPRKQAG